MLFKWLFLSILFAFNESKRVLKHADEYRNFYCRTPNINFQENMKIYIANQIKYFPNSLHSRTEMVAETVCDEFFLHFMSADPVSLVSQLETAHVFLHQFMDSISKKVTFKQTDISFLQQSLRQIPRTFDHKQAGSIFRTPAASTIIVHENVVNKCVPYFKAKSEVSVNWAGIDVLELDYIRDDYDVDSTSPISYYLTILSSFLCLRMYF
ncbi:unnamed protein product [Auanema sp. JU1783]|nr:unnamed protein product [Auanema sp. JU1783]